MEQFLQPEDMFLDPNNNTNQDVIMKSKGKKNSLRLQSMINRCKLLSLSDSDEEHKNKEEKTPSSSKSALSIGVSTKTRTVAANHSHHIRARSNRSPYSHKLLSGKRNRNCWSDIDNSRAHSTTNPPIEQQESTSICNKDYDKNPSKKYPQRMNCQQSAQQQLTAEQTKQAVKKADVSQDFYGDDEASDFFDSTQTSLSNSRVRRVKVRHFRAPIVCPKHDLNTQTFCKRRKIK